MSVLSESVGQQIEEPPLEEESYGIGPGGIFAIVATGFALLFAILFGISRVCRKKETEGEPQYSVAMSNRLFKEVNIDSEKVLPCLNCHLIEMGDMACYQERCQECSQIPPGNSRLENEPSIASASPQKNEKRENRNQEEGTGLVEQSQG